MKRVFAGAAVLALAGVGSTGLAAPVGAQEEQVDWEDVSVLEWDGVRVDQRPLDGNLSPELAAPGQEITVSSECDLATMSDPEHDHEIRWALVEEGSFPGWEGLPEGMSFPAVDQGTVPVPEDFQWTVTFDAPEEAGAYEFAAICTPVDLEGYPHCDIGTYGPTDLRLEVDDDLEPPEEDEEEVDEDEEEEVAPPARPVVDQPEFTG